MEVINKLIELIKSLELPKNPAVWSLVICGLAVWGMNSEWFTNHVREPQWIYAEEENSEILRPAIELQSCDISMVPQINVLFQGDVIYILNITSYYESNVALLQRDGTTEQCVWATADGQKEKLKQVRDDFANLLEQKLSGSGYEPLLSQCEVTLVRLASVNYQRKNKNQKELSRLYIESNAAQVITESEMEKRRAGEWLDLDLYRKEALNDRVEECIDGLLQITK